MTRLLKGTGNESMKGGSLVNPDGISTAEILIGTCCIILRDEARVHV